MVIIARKRDTFSFCLGDQYLPLCGDLRPELHIERSNLMLKAKKWAGKCLQIVERGILSIRQIGLLSSEAFFYILYRFFFMFLFPKEISQKIQLMSITVSC